MFRDARQSGADNVCCNLRSKLYQRSDAKLRCGARHVSIGRHTERTVVPSTSHAGGSAFVMREAAMSSKHLVQSLGAFPLFCRSQLASVSGMACQQALSNGPPLAVANQRHEGFMRCARGSVFTSDSSVSPCQAPLSRAGSWRRSPHADGPRVNGCNKHGDEADCAQPSGRNVKLHVYADFGYREAPARWAPTTGPLRSRAR